MYFEQSPQSTPSSSPSSAPISIGFPVSPAGSLSDNFSRSNGSSKTSCAYPSWPTGSSLSPFGSSAPNSFISDEDLFGDDLLFEDNATPFLREAPPPPRPVPMAQAFPLLSLYASEKKSSKKRRNSRKQPRRSSKPMTPISESPEAPE